MPPEHFNMQEALINLEANAIAIKLELIPLTEIP